MQRLQGKRQLQYYAGQVSLLRRKVSRLEAENTVLKQLLNEAGRRSEQDIEQILQHLVFFHSRVGRAESALLRSEERLNDVLQSRIWRLLCWGGNVVLRFGGSLSRVTMLLRPASR